MSPFDDLTRTQANSNVGAGQKSELRSDEASLVSSSNVLTSLGQAIDLARELAVHLSGIEATDELRELQGFIAKVESYKTALVSQIERTEVWRVDDPNGTVNSYLRHELNWDQRSASAELRTSAAFHEFPELQEALQAGRITRGAIDLILATGLRTEHRRKCLPHFLEAFIVVAASSNLNQLRRVLVAWADQVDPISIDSDDSDARSHRYLRICQVGDGVKVDGFFGIVDGMKILAAINAAFTSMYNETHREGQTINPAEQAEEPALDAASLHSTQRADAFIKMIIEPALDGRVLPTSGGLTPNVVITVPLERLESGPAPLASVHDTLLTGDVRKLELNSAFIETTNGPGRAPLGTTSTLQMTCDANVQRVVLSPESMPLDVGRSTRVIPTGLRRALVIRDGGCQFPFCERPPAWCESHHIQHWAKGGTTEIDNLVLLCSRHHHDVHSMGHEIVMDKERRPQFRLKRPLALE